MAKLNQFVEKNFSKLLKRGMISIGLLGLLLYGIIGTDIVHAATSLWKDEVVIQANTDISVTTQLKYDELMALDISGINPDDIEAYIRLKEELNAQALTDYYNNLLAGMDQGEATATLKAQIDNIANNVLTEMKRKMRDEIALKQ